ncbi:MFS transporter [Mesorhizobium sp. M0644]|uniref:MFS transporter n=1 Tax=unclassified Mesorhizobium TaxID=325217 RepID=UPI00333B9F8A
MSSLPPLSPEQLVKPRHFELRMSLIFFTLFVPLGTHVPYFPLWLQAKGVGVITASHAFLYGFVSIYWKSIGISDSVVGLLWGWGVVAEICMFVVFTRAFASFSVVSIMLIAGIGAIVRWFAFPLIWPLGLGVGGFFAIQTLHAVSVALVLIGLQKMIGETVAEERTGAAQGIAYFSNGFFMAAATLISGPLYDRFGANGFFAMIPIALTGLALIGLAARSAPQRPLGR